MLLAIKNKLDLALRSVGITGEINYSAPPKPELGDLAFACFDFAKTQKKNPNEVAKEIKSKLEIGNLKLGIVERIEIFGPYVNFYLNAGQVAELVLKEIQQRGNKYGTNRIGAGKKVLIEYPSNNTHKEVHIGHLRNICLGNALVNIFRASGYKIIPVNYINDFGSHVAKCLWGLIKFHNGETPPADKQRWLGEIYAEASRYLTDRPELKDEVHELQARLEARDKKIWPLFIKTRQWSLDGFAKVFAELGLKHNAVFYEKDVKNNGQKVVDSLLKKKIAQVGEGGAIIVDLTAENLDIALLRKSNGAGLYLTSDLGLAQAKAKKYKTDESIHITGTEQNLYFKQLFRVLELAGFKYKMTHLGYGLINLTTGKISSRAGNVVLYEELRDEVTADVEAETMARHHDWNKTKIQDAVKKMALTAIKFDLLKHEAAKTIIFDAEAAVSFNGFTGPYILYTIARINSLLSKSKQAQAGKIAKKINYNLLVQPEEKKLLMSLADYDEALTKALHNYNPSVLTKYSFDLAKEFSDFYAQHSVLAAETKELVAARLALSLAVRQVLLSVTSVLGLETVEEM